jgi:hypothetical protein
MSIGRRMSVLVLALFAGAMLVCVVLMSWLDRGDERARLERIAEQEGDPLGDADAQPEAPAIRAARRTPRR